jgi:hypothetical protein
MLAARLAQPGDEFAVALGTTASFGLFGGLLSAAIRWHRSVSPLSSDQHASLHDHDEI